MRDARVVQIVGGSHDGAEHTLRPGQRDLLVYRLGAASWQEADAGEAVPYTVEVYGPATDADALLGRWSLLRTEGP